VDHWKRIGWLDAEPAAAARERERMAEVAPELRWLEGPSGGWEGNLPVWPFKRDRPEGLDDFVEGRALEVRIEYPQSYPMAEPLFVPCDPKPPLAVRSWSTWHVLPNGGLCLLQDAAAWDGTYTAADLVPKASGWFLEYLLVEKGVIEKMTLNGIASDDSLDGHFTALSPQPELEP
jgi:hypothetical protein